MLWTDIIDPADLTGYARESLADYERRQGSLAVFLPNREVADIVARFVTKGSKLYIQGRIETQSWDDKESGQKRYKTQIVADQMTMLGDRKSGDSGERASGAEPGDGGGYAGDDSDIPFAP